jgi:hypothetical protein
MGARPSAATRARGAGGAPSPSAARPYVSERGCGRGTRGGPRTCRGRGRARAGCRSGLRCGPGRTSAGPGTSRSCPRRASAAAIYVARKGPCVPVCGGIHGAAQHVGPVIGWAGRGKCLLQGRDEVGVRVHLCVLSAAAWGGRGRAHRPTDEVRRHGRVRCGRGKVKVVVPADGDARAGHDERADGHVAQAPAAPDAAARAQPGRLETRDARTGRRPCRRRRTRAPRAGRSRRSGSPSRCSRR